MAVGSYSTVAAVVSLAEVWNGQAWSVQHTPNRPNPSSGVWGALNSVSCPSASYCTAVGDYNIATTTLALSEAWDGQAWSIQATPGLPGGVLMEALDGVSCVSADRCVAVGSAAGVSLGTALAESWDGSAWRVIPTPKIKGAENSSLSGVSCPSARACTAVGSSFNGIVTATLAEVWNGSKWRVTPTYNPAGAVLIPLYGVSCSRAAHCIGVGESAGGSGPSTLAEGWNGSSWSVQPTPDPEGADPSALAAVSCPSTDDCLAVGSYFDNEFTAPLAERWNGLAWSILPAAPVPRDAQFAVFAGVSCVSSDECVAVGSYYNGSTNLALAEAWNGSAWSIQTTPSVSGVQASVLHGVSCPTGRECTAVGSYSDANGTWSLAEIWNGSEWSMQQTPIPIGSQFSELNAVSCLTAGRCSSVGDYTNATGTVTLALASNGSAWSIQATPNPAGSFTSVLDALSCPAAKSCTAVGAASAGAGSMSLAEGWDGSAWTIQIAANPTKTSNSALLGLSCRSSRDCTAVGSYENANQTATLTLAEAWNGSVWAAQTTPNPARAEQSYLYSTSCPSPGSCVAVGYYALSSLSSPLPLAERDKS